MYPPHFLLENAIRPNIFALQPHATSTSDQFGPRASILLDANENPLGNPFSKQSVFKGGQSSFDVHSPTAVSQARLLSLPQASVVTPGLGSLNEQSSTLYSFQIPKTSSVDKPTSDTGTPFSDGSRDRHSDPDTRDAPSSISSYSNNGVLAGDDDMLASLHRYPSSAQFELKRKIADWKGLRDTTCICLGIGAADLADAAIRMTCIPSKESILVTPPTFGLYKARAMLNDVGTIQCPLKQENGDFVLDVPQVLESLAANPQIKLVFLASPGNPTGSLISLNDVRTILSFEAFKGVVVVDEVYIDFCPEASSASAVNLLGEFANLVVLQSMSKTLGLAGLRLGMAFGHSSVIEQLHKIQMPYCISTPTTMIATRALSSAFDEQRVKSLANLIEQREKLIAGLATLRKASGHGLRTPLGMSQANFIVLPLLEPDEQQCGNVRAKLITERLKSEHSISVKYIGDLDGCEGCIRITVGTKWENKMLVQALGVVLESC